MLSTCPCGKTFKQQRKPKWQVTAFQPLEGRAAQERSAVQQLKTKAR